MSSLSVNNKEELKLNTSLVVAEQAAKEEWYENFTEKTYPKAKGSLVKVERKVIKKKKRKINFVLPEGWTFGKFGLNIMKFVLIVFAALNLRPIFALFGVDLPNPNKVVDMNKALDSTITAEKWNEFIHGPLKPVSLNNAIETWTVTLVDKIIPMVVLGIAIAFIIVWAKRTIKIENVGEKEKIKEKVSDFQVPYPDEFYNARLTDSEAKPSDNTESRMYFVPNEDESRGA